MNVRRNASQDANDWAEKKKQQLEKARQLKEERKQGLMRVAEKEIVGSSTGFNKGMVGGMPQGGGGYNQDFNQNMNSNYNGQYGGRGGNNYGAPNMNDMQQNQYTPSSQFGTGKYSQYNQETVGGASRSNFNTGEMRNGYQQQQQQSYSKGGPVKAVDLGFDNGIGNQRQMGGGYQQKQGGFDQYENMNTASTKSSMQPQNTGSNYRKAFNPNSQLQNSESSNFRQSNSSHYYEPQVNNQQRRSVQPNDRNTISSREKAQRYDNIPTGNKGQNSASRQANMRTLEEKKYEYQPQKRELPNRKMPPQSNNNKQQNNYQGGYQDYDNEISSQVIPAVQKKQGRGGFEDKLGPEAFQKPSDMNLSECPSCGRSFNPEAYQKHVKVCKKVFVQKRKAFNSQAHRILSNEHKQILTQAKRADPREAPMKQQQQVARNNQPIKAMGGKGPKWKNQSEQFRQAMRAARGPVTKGGASHGGGGGGYSQPAPDQYDDRTGCPHCGRKFNDVAAQRHIPYCQNKSKESAMRAGPVRGGKTGYRR